MRVNVKRNIIIVGALFIVLMYSQRDGNNDTDFKLQAKNGVYYKVNSSTPFSGKVLVRYESGPVNNEGNSRVGKVHFENEYSDGVLVSTVHYNKLNDSKACV